MDTSAAPRPALEHQSVASSRIAAPHFRIDAKYYRTEFLAARAQVRSNWFSSVAMGSIASAYVPPRTKLVTVPNEAAGAPYLQPHSAFEIRPFSNRYISRRRTPDYEKFLLRKGMILTPASGRNFGSVIYVGGYLAHFAMTDILRVVPKDNEDGFFLLAYLQSSTAQALLRMGPTGTVINHLAPRDVESIPVAWPDEPERRVYADHMERSERLLDEGRFELEALSLEVHQRLGLPVDPPEGEYVSAQCGLAFGLTSRNVGLRLDSASHDPTVRQCARTLKEKGGVELGQVAALKTLPRYNRYYVESPRGRPHLSGRQILQLRPVALQNISDRSFNNPSHYVLQQGQTIFTCDGRSEGALGTPAYVMPIWDGWVASEHIMRATPQNGIGSGFLYLVLSSPWVQRQLKARATGSVIDALEPEEIDRVVIPMLGDGDRLELDQRVRSSWDKISASVATATATVRELDGWIAGSH